MVHEMTEIEDQILKIVGELTMSRRMEILDFAMFLQTQEQRQPDLTDRPEQRLEDLYGGFWPEDESVDDFIEAVQQWRQRGIENLNVVSAES